MPPLMEASHDGQQLLVVDLVVLLCRRHLAGVEGYGMPTRLCFLLEHACNGEVAGIGLEACRLVVIEVTKYPSRRERLDELVKRLDCLFGSWNFLNRSVGLTSDVRGFVMRAKCEMNRR